MNAFDIDRRSPPIMEVLLFAKNFVLHNSAQCNSLTE
jgi:hypothetical protein